MSPAVGTAWTLVFAAAALLCLVSLVRHRGASRSGAAAEANHVVMAVAMAVMAAPGGMAVVPPALGLVAFGAAATAWLACLLVAGLRGTPLGSPIGHARCTAHPTHLLLVNLAMAVMYAPMLGAGAAEHGAGEHAGHGGASGSLTLPLLATGLAVYLVVHAAATLAVLVARSRRAPAPDPADAAQPADPAAPTDASGGGTATLLARAPSRTVTALTTPRAQLLCQAVMGIGMAAMLVWMA